MLIKPEQVVDYIKNNIEPCLTEANIELDSITRKNMDGTLQLIPRIEVTIEINPNDFIDYVVEEGLREADD